MPIYEFVCESCGHEFEQILAFSATKMPHCPACQSEHVRRQMSRPAIHFKGSGWYITDSKVASKVSANGTDKEKSGSGEGNVGDVSSTGSAAASDSSGATESNSSESKEVKTTTKGESTKAE